MIEAILSLWLMISYYTVSLKPAGSPSILSAIDCVGNCKVSSSWNEQS